MPQDTGYKKFLFEQLSNDGYITDSEQDFYKNLEDDGYIDFLYDGLSKVNYIQDPKDVFKSNLKKKDFSVKDTRKDSQVRFEPWLDGAKQVGQKSQQPSQQVSQQPPASSKPVSLSSYKDVAPPSTQEVAATTAEQRKPIDITSEKARPALQRNAATKIAESTERLMKTPEHDYEGIDKAKQEIDTEIKFLYPDVETTEIDENGNLQYNDKFYDLAEKVMADAYAEEKIAEEMRLQGVADFSGLSPIGKLGAEFVLSFDALAANTLSMVSSWGEMAVGSDDYSVANYFRKSAEEYEKSIVDIKLSKGISRDQIEKGGWQTLVEGDAVNGLSLMMSTIVQAAPTMAMIIAAPEVQLSRMLALRASRAGAVIPNMVGSTATTGMQVTKEMLKQTAETLGTKTNTGIALLSAMEAKDTYEDALANGKTDLEALAIATTKAMATYVGEHMFMGAEQQVRESIVNFGAKKAKKDAATKFKDIVAELRETAGKEGFMEEGTINLVGQIVDNIADGKPFNFYSFLDESTAGIGMGVGATLTSKAIQSAGSLYSTVATNADLRKMGKQIATMKKEINSGELSAQEKSIMTQELSRIEQEYRNVAKDVAQKVDSYEDADKQRFVEINQEILATFDVYRNSENDNVKAVAANSIRELIAERNAIESKYGEPAVDVAGDVAVKDEASPTVEWDMQNPVQETEVFTESEQAQESEQAVPVAKKTVMGKEVSFYENHLPENADDVDKSAMYSFKSNKKEDLPQILQDKAKKVFEGEITVNGKTVKKESWVASIDGNELFSLYENKKTTTEQTQDMAQDVLKDVERDEEADVFSGVELTMRRPKENEIIFVSVDELLDKHAKDQPQYDIQKKENRIGNRVEKAKKFIQDYIKDQRFINPKTGGRENNKVSFEPSVVDADETGKISFEDGRHRVLAAKELGIKKVPIEVPKTKSEKIKNTLTPTQNDTQKEQRVPSVEQGGKETRQPQDKKAGDKAIASDRDKQEEATNEEIDSVATQTGVKAKNLRDLYKLNRELWGLNKIKAFASAVVMDKMIGAMAKRKGVTKQQMYDTIEFRKGDENTFKELSARGKALFQLVGENANLADKVRANLGVARDMEAAGKDNKTIRIATGWEKGVDGKWRYEVDDFKSLTKDGYDFIKNGKIGDSLPLKMFYDDVAFKELLKLYPKLEKISVMKADIGMAAASAHVDNNLIKTGSLFEYSYMNHEVQHFIQNYEGFARGGSVLDGKSLAEKANIKELLEILSKRSDVRDSKSDLKNKLKHLEDLLKKSKSFSFFKRNKSEIEKIQNELNSLSNELSKKEFEFSLNNERLIRFNSKMNDLSLRYYEIISGEVEARNVQTRMGMTPEQRRETTLQETEDVARDEQIVLFDGAQTMPDGVRFQIDAWHGSPYQVDKFSVDKIGTGEGAQAFGWGLYFTELKSVAEWYAKKLAITTFKGEKIDDVDFFEKLLSGLDANDESFYDIDKGTITDLNKFRQYIKDLIESFEQSIPNINKENKKYQSIADEYTYKNLNVSDLKADIDVYKHFEKVANESSDKNDMINKALPLFKAKADAAVKMLLEVNRGKKNREAILDSIIDYELRRAKSSLNYYKYIDNNFDKFNHSRILYKVSLHKGKTPDQYTWLEWDKPISEKAKKSILEFISKDEKYNHPTWVDAKRKIKYALENGLDVTGEDFYKRISSISGLGGKEASLFLLDAGIDGIKYPAESVSSGATSDNARGFNYVVFDENAISIEEVIKFQKDAVKARGAMMMGLDGKAIIYALTDPNVSTPLHELAHVFEHYLTEQERASVIKWAGGKEWTTETSEKFARGFEKYLADGKAPTASLQALFDRFKQWLIEIYNGVTNSAIDIKLNDEMSDIYAKMLGEKSNTKQLAEAEKLLKAAWKDWKDAQKNIGIAFDPRSQAAQDVMLTKAIVNYLYALGVEKVGQIKKKLQEVADFINSNIADPADHITLNPDDAEYYAKLIKSEKAKDLQQRAIAPNSSVKTEMKYAIAAIDVTKMSGAGQAKFTDAIERMMNDDYSDTGWLISESRNQEGVKNMEEARRKVKAKMRPMGKTPGLLANFHTMINKMYMSDKLSSKFMAYFGIADIFAGKAGVDIKRSKLEDEYSEIIKGNPKVNTVAQRALRSFAANLMRAKDEAEFMDMLNQIKGSIEVFKKNGSPSQQKDAEEMDGAFFVIEEQLEELKKAWKTRGTDESRQHLISAIGTANVEIIEFFQDLFAKQLPSYKEHMSVLRGKELDELEYSYTPRKRIKLSIDDVQIDPFENYFSEGSISNKETFGNEEAKMKVNVKEYPLAYDFDMDMMNEWYARELDVAIGQNIHQLKELIRFGLNEQRVDYARLFGESYDTSNQNAKQIEGWVRNYLTRASSEAFLSPSEKAVLRSASEIGNWGSKLALGSVAQLAKQSTVLVRALVHLYRNPNAAIDGAKVIANWFKSIVADSNQHDAFMEIINSQSIGKRSYMKYGMRELYEKMPKAERQRFIEKVGRGIYDAYGSFRGFTDKTMMTWLELSDSSAAKLSWGMFYSQYMNNEFGVKNVDWVKEKDNLNKEAAAYAEMMVAKTQQASEVEQTGGLMGGTDADSKKHMAVDFLRMSIFPFLTFTANRAANAKQDIQKIFSKTAPKEEALKDLAGMAAEGAAFLFVGKAITSLIGSAAEHVMKEFYDVEPPEEDDDEKAIKEKADNFALVMEGLFTVAPFYGLGIADNSVQMYANKYFFNNYLTDEQQEGFFKKGMYKYLVQDERSIMFIEESDAKEMTGSEWMEYLKQKAGDKDIVQSYIYEHARGNKNKVVSKEDMLANAMTDIEMGAVLEQAYTNFNKSFQSPFTDFSAFERKGGKLGVVKSFATDTWDSWEEYKNADFYQYINRYGTVSTKQYTPQEKQLLLLSAITQSTGAVLPQDIKAFGKQLRRRVRQLESQRK
jgi:hypothetical protein